MAMFPTAKLVEVVGSKVPNSPVLVMGLVALPTIALSTLLPESSIIHGECRDFLLIEGDQGASNVGCLACSENNEKQ